MIHTFLGDYFDGKTMEILKSAWKKNHADFEYFKVKMLDNELLSRWYITLGKTD